MRRLLPLALLAAAACIDDLEPPQYLVTDLRVLGVRAEVLPAPDDGTTWADAIPGGTVEVEALVANPRGRADLQLSWYACLPTLAELPSPCTDPDVLRDPAALATTSGVLRLDGGSCVSGSRSSTCAVSVAVPRAVATPDGGTAEEHALWTLVQALQGRATPPGGDPTYACLLYAELPIVVVAEAEGVREVALKRVRLTPDPATLGDPLAGRYVRNTNPAVGGVVRADTEEACAPVTPPELVSVPPGRSFLCASVAAGAQTFNTTCPDDGGAPIQDVESLEWQWFVTAGELLDAEGVGNVTESAPELEAPAGPFTLWVVLRDGRGGVGWLERADVAVAP